MRLIVLLVTATLTSTSAVASDGLTPDQIKKIKIGIEQDKLEYVTDSLRGVENPFRCVKSGLGKLFDSTPSHYCTRENVAQDLLNLAFKAKPCRDQIAVTLLKAGGRFDFGAKYSTEKVLKDAYENFCSRTVEHIIATGPEDEVASAATKFFAQAAQKVKSYVETLKDGYEVDKHGIEALKPMSEAFREFAISKCPDVSKATAACFARESFETAKIETEKVMAEAMAEAQEEDAKTEYAASPEGMRAAACEIDQQIAEAQAEIDRQKEIGKVSGTVNMVVLNRAGAKIVDRRKARKELERRYKLKAGRSLSNDGCNKLK